jgi:hypothetical protein
MKVEDKKIRKGEKAGLGVAHKKGQKKKRIVSVKGQMRSLQRLLNKVWIYIIYYTCPPVDRPLNLLCKPLHALKPE